MKKITIQGIKVSVKLTEESESSEKAIATLTIGPFKIKGFRVLPSNFTNRHGEKIWVTPPSYKSKDGRWHHEFFCEDKELWREIEDLILEEYNHKVEKSPF